MAKKFIILAAGVLVMGSTLTGLGQRAGRAGKLQPVIVENTGGTMTRGWVKKGRGKGRELFIDVKGKTMDLAEGTKIFTLPEMERQFKAYQQSLLKQDLNASEQDTKLMEWAGNHLYYEGVLTYAEKLKRLNPTNPDPQIEEAVKSAQEKLAEYKAPPGEGGGSDWTMHDVQKVRFALLPVKGPVENLPVIFKKNVLRRFIDEMAQAGKLTTTEEQRQFNALRPAEKVQRIKLETADAYQADIVIGKDPKQITEFRRVVEPILARSCASANCHGSGNLQFKLIPQAASIPDVYANFYFLDTFHAKKGGVIDHDQPEKSLLLNYLTPGNLALNNLTHPTQIIPLIKSKRDPRYTQLLAWLRSLPPQSIDQTTGQESAASQPTEPTTLKETPEVPATPKLPRLKK